MLLYDTIELAIVLLSEFSLFSGVIAVCLGAIVGSFLNVVIYRLPIQRSVVFPGSGCGGCGVPLRWWNNIPVLSYLFQGGKCEQCGSCYSPRYMLIEALMGLIGFLLLNHLGGFGWAWLYQFVFAAIAVAVFFTDVDHWIIPDEINVFGVLFGVALAPSVAPRGDMLVLVEIFGGWVPQGNLVSSLLGVLVGIGFFWCIQLLGLVIARQEAMGDGDVKYAAVLGAFLGWQYALLAFVFSFFLGGVIALPLMLSSRGKGKEPVPFGTFMSLAAVPVSLWGGWLWDKIYYFEGFYTWFGG